MPRLSLSSLFVVASVLLFFLAATALAAGHDTKPDNLRGVPPQVQQFTTGITGAGAPIAVGQLDDQWLVNGGGYSGRAKVTAPSSWQPNTATSQWIGPPNALAAPCGQYIYQLDFTMNYEPDEVEVVLQFAADDYITAVMVNGVPRELPNGGTSFRLGAPYILRGWNKGRNWMHVSVLNQGNGVNPTGLRVESSVRGSPRAQLSTGMFSNGSVRPEDNGNSDQNWMMAYGGGQFAASVVKPNTAWQANSAKSKWIAASNGAWDAPAGCFTYSNVFDMNDFDPAYDKLVLRVAADDKLVRLLLNGKDMALPQLGPNFTFGKPYVLAGWKPGRNALEITVHNGGGPSGLRVSAKVVDVNDKRYVLQELDNREEVEQVDSEVAEDEEEDEEYDEELLAEEFDEEDVAQENENADQAPAENVDQAPVAERNRSGRRKSGGRQNRGQRRRRGSRSYETGEL